MAVGSLWLILLNGCTTPPANDASQYIAIDGAGWRYGTPVTFTPTFRDSVATGHIVAAVTHSSDYPYTTLVLEITGTDARGQNFCDTARFAIADEFGRWNGSGIGPDFQVTDTIRHPVTLTAGSPIKVRHVMQTDTLQGVENVGLFFMAEKAAPGKVK